MLELVAQLGGGWWDGALALRRPEAATMAIADLAARADGLDGAARAWRTAADGRGAVAVSHYDPARDYQAGVQRAGRPGVAAERIEVPAVLDGGEAAALAAALLARARADRVRRTLTTGLDVVAVAPGTIVSVVGEDGTWRVVGTAFEAMAVRLTLAPVARAMLAGPAATSGRVAAAADDPAGATLLRLIDLPPLDDALPASPRVAVIAAGSGAGWRRAGLLWSVDDGASWTAVDTAQPGTVGTVEAAPLPAPATLVDRAGVLVVRLARGDMMLADADAGALDRGANLAAAGGELIQFGRAVPIGGGRWRLSELLRGRRGTEATPVAAGDGFALIDEASVRTIELPLAAIGRELRVIASGVGDAAAVEARLTVEGRAVRPPSPVRLRWEAGEGGATLRWTRRSRAGWRWIDGVDAPLGEERERYRVTLASGREVECDAPALWVPDEDRGRVEVRQRGTVAESRAAIWEEQE